VGLCSAFLRGLHAGPCNARSLPDIALLPLGVEAGIVARFVRSSSKEGICASHMLCMLRLLLSSREACIYDAGMATECCQTAEPVQHEASEA
jgi:hypothetical protein